MNELTNYKRRFIGYLFTTFLLGLIVYSIAIKPTVVLNKDLTRLKNNLIKLRHAPQEIISYENRINTLDSLIGKDRDPTIDFQKSLLSEISGICTANSLMLSEFPQIHTWNHQNYDFLTGFAKVEGRFSPLCRLLNELEINNSFGKILSVDFQAANDPRTKKRKLSMAIYIQIIKQSGHENE